MAETGRKEPLSLQNKLNEVRCPDEDWSGKSSAEERRRLQNRLHQRAWRRRRKEAQEHPACSSRDSSIKASSVFQETPEANSISAAFEAATAALVPKAPQKKPDRLRVVASSQDLQSSHRHALPEVPQRGSPKPLQRQQPSSVHELMSLNLHYASSRPSTRIPPANLYHLQGFSCILPYICHFPISPDHYLITLVQYNAFRAIMSNLSLCAVLDSLGDSECHTALFRPVFEPPSSPPPSFAPTALQLSTKNYSPWIASIPCARLRDNLILAEMGERWEEEELCEDICGGLFEGYDDTSRKGLMVWGEPWQVQSWEMTDGFVEKWGWLVRGCTEMVESTNRWRESRGEERLIIEVE